MRNPKKLWLIITAIVLGVVIISGVLSVTVFQNIYQSTRFLDDESVTYNRELITETDLELETQPAFDYKSVPLVSPNSRTGTYSILLIGTDMREDEYGNSDAMILMTINENVKKVFMVSFMRDLYADIPDVGVRKLNSAYAIGAGPLLVKTIESNYGVDIDNYICVNFDTMSQIVDAVGGVDIEIDKDEKVTANDYITSMAEELNYDPEDYYIKKTGNIHMNGVQAVGYARIRYVGNADYERTSRQREVLTAIMDELTDFNISKISAMVTTILPKLQHNLTQRQTLQLLSLGAQLGDFEIVTDRIPYDDMFTVENEILIPYMQETIDKLHEEIYAGAGQDNYPGVY